MKVSIITLLVVANIAVLGYVWLLWTGNNLLSGANTDEDVVAALDPTSGGDRTFVVVGSDSREGLESLDNFGSAAGAREACPRRRPFRRRARAAARVGRRA